MAQERPAWGAVTAGPRSQQDKTVGDGVQIFGVKWNFAKASF